MDLDARFSDQLRQYTNMNSGFTNGNQMSFPMPIAQPSLLIQPPAVAQQTTSWFKQNSKLVIFVVLVIIAMIVVIIVLKSRKSKPGKNEYLTQDDLSPKYPTQQQTIQHIQQQQQLQQQQQQQHIQQQRAPQPQIIDTSQRLPFTPASSGGYPTPPLLVHPQQQQQQQQVQQLQNNPQFQQQQPSLVNAGNPTGAIPISASGTDAGNDPNFTPL